MVTKVLIDVSTAISRSSRCKEILRAVLTEKVTNSLNLALAIERRFAHFGDFK
ncbi:hypothetical protein [Coleofasciculus sp. F4-SAH-05]|uniref:hypothetical protein n=1 Tax=Coleofasciculus sp. F4-SAH-05 TaxID=3069525 RepID=UPI0032F3D85F